MWDFFIENDKLYLVLEYMENGSLSSILKSIGKFNEQKSKKILY